MSKKKILIVEDEKPLANAMRIKLESVGFEVTVAHGGEKGLAELAQAHFDLILLDIIMPEPNGFEFIKKAKQAGEIPPVFIVSNLSQDEDKARAQGLGVVEYIVKSDTPLNDIVEKVETFLNKKSEE